MRDDDSLLLKVAAARVDFLDQGRQNAADISDLVVASWERCRVAGVDDVQPRSVFSDDIDTDALLSRCARPVLDRLAVDTADLPLVIGLTDKKTRVVERIDASSTVTGLFDRVQYAPGFDFSEATVGTNGAGTVFEAGQPVSVVGPEHFAERLQSFAATGAPILDPVTGRVEGVVSIASPARAWNPIMAALVKGAAKEISRGLLRDRSQHQHAIFDAYLRATARSARSAAFAFGHALAIASPAARQLFEPGEQQLLCEHATFLLAHQDRISDTLALPNSQRLVRLRATRIFAGSTAVGALVFVEPVLSLRTESEGGAAAPPPPRHRPAATETPFRVSAAPAGGRSLAWLRARAELCDALHQRKPALLVGEAGVGKVTLATELFHALHPGTRCVVLYATRLAADGPLPRGADGPILHILRGIDQVSTDGADRLRAYLTAVTSLEEPGWVVATVQHAQPTADLPFGDLLAQFDTAITVPALRYRTDDLPGIAAAVLQTIAPQRNVRLSPAAQQLICRYSWPRNITQLREALEHAVHRRPVGEIHDVDLPGYCRTAARRTLTVLEGVERDAIVAALRETSGNRVAAAAQLGMSRSSLYRKLRTYGITV